MTVSRSLSEYFAKSRVKFISFIEMQGHPTGLALPITTELDNQSVNLDRTARGIY
jgi:hypothetical protein